MNKKYLIILFTILMLFGQIVRAATFPGKKSPLYSQRAHHCQAVNLKTWKHPTRKVLEQYHITIQKVELCNNKKYPIFTIKADDFTGYTVKEDNRFIGFSALGDKFYKAMWKANSKWPMAIVETGAYVTVYLEKDPKNPSKYTYNADFEDYTGN